MGYHLKLNHAKVYILVLAVYFLVVCNKEMLTVPLLSYVLTSHQNVLVAFQVCLFVLQYSNLRVAVNWLIAFKCPFSACVCSTVPWGGGVKEF